MSLTVSRTLGFITLALAGATPGWGQATPRTHRLPATPATVAWGYYWSEAKPALRIASGDIVEVETLLTSSPRTLEGAGIPPAEVEASLRAITTEVTDKGPGGHILTGPIFVEGAEPGDVLEVRILSIALALPYGYNGCSGFIRELCSDPRTRIIRLDHKQMIADMGGGIRVPLRPFFGSMGVAPPPESGRVSSNPPGIHAGNLDNKELVAGTTLFIPVHVNGALFEVGDGHAAQGDGEVNQTAIETSLRGRLQFVVRKDMKLSWPRGETPTHIISMGTDTNLTVATRTAVREMVAYLAEAKALPQMEAYRMASIAGDLRITQLVDGKVGVHMMMAKSVLGPPLGGEAPGVPPSNYPAPVEGDFVIRNFTFGTGEVLPELRQHYRTLGTPVRDAAGVARNAVLITHGTTGSGRGFLSPTFAGRLFGPGQLLDATKYFIILPDGIGHGQSSKPSDGLRMKFPKYTYDDMVKAQYRLLSEKLGVNHLRLAMGTSMGAMHTWIWGYTYPDFMDALMPLASLPVEIAGRNRMMRQMVIDDITKDPEWQGGNYTTQPRGLVPASQILYLMTSTPLQWQKDAPTRAAAESTLAVRIARYQTTLDANDMLYAYEASRNYDPSPHLGRITAPLLAINSADDQVNPPELGLMEREIGKVPRGRFVLLPITDQTRGHGTHSLPAIWGPYLAELLSLSARPFP